MALTNISSQNKWLFLFFLCVALMIYNAVTTFVDTSSTKNSENKIIVNKLYPQFIESTSQSVINPELSRSRVPKKRFKTVLFGNKFNATCFVIALMKNCGSEDWGGTLLYISGPNDFNVEIDPMALPDSPVSKAEVCNRASGAYLISAMTRRGAEISSDKKHSVRIYTIKINCIFFRSHSHFVRCCGQS